MKTMQEKGYHQISKLDLENLLITRCNGLKEMVGDAVQNNRYPIVVGTNVLLLQYGKH